MAVIGVTGHRVLAEPDTVRTGVSDALRRIERAFPHRPLTIISALAEGADRLVARQALTRPGARLVVPLPLPVADYLKEFGAADSKAEFLALLQRADEVVELPVAPARATAYAAAGDYVVDHSDVLLAVWDGRDAQGEGGTATVVGRARERGLPLAWVRAGNRTPGTLAQASLGETQGTVSYERLPP